MDRESEERKENGTTERQRGIVFATWQNSGRTPCSCLMHYECSTVWRDLQLKNIFLNFLSAVRPNALCSPVVFVMSSCCSRSGIDWSVNLSIWSINHWSCGSSLIAAYSLTKVCGLSDMWSSANSLAHCCHGSLTFSNVLTSRAPMTASWNKKPIMSPGLMLLTNIECSFWNLSFNTSFDSRQLAFIDKWRCRPQNIKVVHIHNTRSCKCVFDLCLKYCQNNRPANWPATGRVKPALEPQTRLTCHCPEKPTWSLIGQLMMLKCWLTLNEHFITVFALPLTETLDTVNTNIIQKNNEASQGLKIFYTVA